MSNEHTQEVAPAPRKRAPNKTLAERRAALQKEMAALDQRERDVAVQLTAEVCKSIGQLRQAASAAKLAGLVEACTKSLALFDQATPKS